MELAFKPDWEETKQRYLAWWKGELLDRCCVAVTAPKANPPAGDPPVYTGERGKHWFDFEWWAAYQDWAMARTFYGGEALPNWHAGYPGWAGIPTFLGCPTELDEVTGWWDPMLNGDTLADHDYNQLVITEDAPNWKLAHELIAFGAEHARGKALMTVGAFGGCGDTLAALRGSLPLLYDLADCPDYVRDFELYLMRQWIDVYEGFYQQIREVDEGSTCWFNLWSPGKFYAAQNDFSYMISPKSFEEVFIPALELQLDYLDNAVYHVDGICAFVHVPALTKLERLEAIQILPGAGKPSPLYYLDACKAVQAGGKNLHITIPIGEVEEALRLLKPEGLFLDTYASTEEEARALLKQVEKWTCERPWEAHK